MAATYTSYGFSIGRIAALYSNAMPNNELEIDIQELMQNPEKDFNKILATLEGIDESWVKNRLKRIKKEMKTPVQGIRLIDSMKGYNAEDMAIKLGCEFKRIGTDNNLVAEEIGKLINVDKDTVRSLLNHRKDVTPATLEHFRNAIG